MGYMSEEEFNLQMEIIKKQNLVKERKAKLKKEQDKYKQKRKLPSTSKLVLFGVILLCLEIVIFCEYIMLAIGDTSALYVLIGIPASLIPIVWGYYSKSKAENTSGGIVFETAMAQFNQGCEESMDDDANLC